MPEGPTVEQGKGLGASAGNSRAAGLADTRTGDGVGSTEGAGVWTRLASSSARRVVTGMGEVWVGTG